MKRISVSLIAMFMILSSLNIMGLMNTSVNGEGLVDSYWMGIIEDSPVPVNDRFADMTISTTDLPLDVAYINIATDWNVYMLMNVYNYYGIEVAAIQETENDDCSRFISFNIAHFIHVAAHGNTEILTWEDSYAMIPNPNYPYFMGSGQPLTLASGSNLLKTLPKDPWAPSSYYDVTVIVDVWDEYFELDFNCPSMSMCWSQTLMTLRVPQNEKLDIGIEFGASFGHFSPTGEYLPGELLEYNVPLIFPDIEVSPPCSAIPRISLNQQEYGWYITNPGSIIDVDFSSNGGEILTLAQWALSDSNIWYTIFSEDTHAYSSNWPIIWSVLAQGHNEVKIRLYNRVGLMDEKTIIIKKDTVSPISYISSPPHAEWLNTKPYLITATATDTSSGVTSVKLMYRFNQFASPTGEFMTYPIEATTEPYTFNFDLPNGDGYYEFYTVAADNVGNIEPPSSIYVQYKFDTTPPPIPVIIGPTGASLSPVTFQWGTVTDLTGITRYQLELDWVTRAYPLTTSYQISSVAVGSHTWRVRAEKDGAGNWGTWSAGSFYVTPVAEYGNVGGTVWTPGCASVIPGATITYVGAIPTAIPDSGNTLFSSIEDNTICTTVISGADGTWGMAGLDSGPATFTASKSGYYSQKLFYLVNSYIPG
jgi:hypothetical protein